ncbi:MAG: CDP-archaeol synthase [Bacteroidota bacterium]
MLRHLNIVVFPLIISNIIHMVLVKKDVFPFLKIPVSERLFGQNKTWRGFIFLSILNGIFTPIFAYDIPVLKAVCFGMIFGLIYMIFELPNSLFKRKMGIAAGENPAENKLLFSLLDKTDSAFGVCLVYFLISDIDVTQIIQLFFISSFIHITFSMLLVSLKIKKSF